MTRWIWLGLSFWRVELWPVEQVDGNDTTRQDFEEGKGSVLCDECRFAYFGGVYGVIQTFLIRALYPVLLSTLVKERLVLRV